MFLRVLFADMQLDHCQEAADPLKMDRRGIADKTEVEAAEEAYIHKGDNIVDRFDHEEVVAQLGKGIAALDAASPDFCYHRHQMVHLNPHLAREQGHPFFEDPLRDKMPSPAEVVGEY